MINITSDQINQLRTLIDGAKEGIIVVTKNPSLDAMASSLALYLSLTSKGKNLQIISPTTTTVEFSHLIGVDKVKNHLNGSGNGRNLIISFPYQEGSIEKVSYNIENDTFNLVIEPREGYTTITPEMIQYSYSGGNIDFIITVGVEKLTDLDYLYSNNQTAFSNHPIVNIDIDTKNQRFGRINIIETGVSSLSELTLSLISNLGFNLDNDIATNLLYGITAGSQNFSSEKTSASTFEMAALCLRNGARKPKLYPQNTSPQLRTEPFFAKPQPNYQKPFPSNFEPNQTVKPKQSKPFPKSPPPSQSTKQNNQNEAPPDWLKPKIYKGSTLL